MQGDVQGNKISITDLKFKSLVATESIESLQFLPSEKMKVILKVAKKGEWKFARASKKKGNDIIIQHVSF